MSPWEILGLVLMGLVLVVIAAVFILVASVDDEQHLPRREPKRGNTVDGRVK